MRADEVVYDWRRPGLNRAAALATTNYQRRTRTVILDLRRAGDPKHGTYTAYQKGCACEPCRAAMRVHQRHKRAMERA